MPQAALGLSSDEVPLAKDSQLLQLVKARRAKDAGDQPPIQQTLGVTVGMVSSIMACRVLGGMG